MKSGDNYKSFVLALTCSYYFAENTEVQFCGN